MLRHLSYLVKSGLGLADYWHPYLEIQEDFQNREISRYPISMHPKGNYPGTLNAEGVPVIDQGEEVITTPVVVLLYGLGSSDLLFLTKDPRYERQFVHARDWLVKHQVPFGTGIGWPHQMDMGELKAPWFSCITQGLALSLFVRAQKLQPIPLWKEIAVCTYRGFHVPIDDGGFLRVVQDGFVYEEYPTVARHFVFNGMCTALIGLWEAWSYGLVPEAENEFRQGVRALRSHLRQFDHDGWSLYSLDPCLGRPFLASPYYQRANGLLAQVVGFMADEPELTMYGQRWIRSSESPLRRLIMSARIALDRAPHGLFRPVVKLQT